MGLFRFFLCSAVIYFHLSGSSMALGQVSVFGFYVISGYLITLVLNKSYHFRLKEFALNRFLRLYPAYAAIALLSLTLGIAFPADYAHFHGSWTFSWRWQEILGNLLIFPWAFFDDATVPANVISIGVLHRDGYYFRVVPSTWSVAVELVCYALLWLFIARGPKHALASLSAAVLYFVFIRLKRPYEPLLYYPWMAAVLPFSVGSLTFQLKSRYPALQREIPNAQATVMTFVLIGVFLANHQQIRSPYSFSPFYYVNIVLCAIGVLLQSNYRLTGVSKRLDKLLGDLSYPLFLLQYPAGLIAYKLLGAPAMTRGPLVFVLGYGIAIAISLALIASIDIPIQRLRERVKTRLPAS